MDLKKEVKDILINKKFGYPENVLYESFLKHNADLYLNPDNCEFVYNKFGISVYPDCFNIKKHSILRLTIDVEGKIKTNDYLPHQIYLHDLVLKMWDAEKKGRYIYFKIECIRSKDEYVEF